MGYPNGARANPNKWRDCRKNDKAMAEHDAGLATRKEMQAPADYVLAPSIHSEEICPQSRSPATKYCSVWPIKNAANGLQYRKLDKEGTWWREFDWVRMRN